MRRVAVPSVPAVAWARNAVSAASTIAPGTAAPAPSFTRTVTARLGLRTMRRLLGLPDTPLIKRSVEAHPCPAVGKGHQSHRTHGVLHRQREMKRTVGGRLHFHACSPIKYGHRPNDCPGNRPALFIDNHAIDVPEIGIRSGRRSDLRNSPSGLLLFDRRSAADLDRSPGDDRNTQHNGQHNFHPDACTCHHTPPRIE